MIVIQSEYDILLNNIYYFMQRIWDSQVKGIAFTFFHPSAYDDSSKF